MADSSGSPHSAPPHDDASPPANDTGTLNTQREAQRLHPITLLQRIVASLPALAFLLLPALTSSDTESWFTLAIALAYGLFALPSIVLQYVRFSYRVTPKEIIIQSGVLTRKNRSIPIERVQNIQIEQPLLPRLTGTARVKIETAGSSSTEGVLEYIGLEEAHNLRRTIRSFKEQAASSPAGAGTEAEPGVPATASSDDEDLGTPLFAMSMRRVLLSGAFRFSLLYIAVIFSFIELLNPDPNDIARWMTRGELEGLLETATTSPWLVGIATVLVAGFFAWCTGIAVNLNKYYNFRLWRDDEKLRFKRGLITLSEGTIPLNKVQTLILRTNPLMRFFGWYALEVQTVGLNVEEQGHRVVVPFAQKAEILPIAQQITEFSMPDSLSSVSPLTIRRHFVRYTAVLIVLTAIASYVATLINGVAIWQDVWWALALAPLIGVYAVLHYRNHGYAVGEDGFYVRRGVVRQYLWITPVEKYHVFYRKASLFQRRLGLESLFVDTAGAAAFAYPEVIDLPKEAAAETLDRLHDQFGSLYAERLRAATAPSDSAPPDRRPAIPEEELREL
jgi:putative membrane protein